MDQERARPLEGVRVVSIALNVPGPLAVARLRSEGARVVKVEPPTGDPLAAICRAWYDELHEDVSIEQLDLKTTEGSRAMRALLADADVFVSSQRPASLARLGLDDSSVEHLWWLNVVGELAHPETPGHDLTYQARAGLLGESMPISLFADVLGAERAFAGVLLLLRQPRGARATVGLYDSLAPLAAPLVHGLTAPGGHLGGGFAAYRIYRAREGAVAVAALEPRFRQRLYASLELALDTDLSDIVSTRTAAEWEQWARERDLPIAAVRTAMERQTRT